MTLLGLLVFLIILGLVWYAVTRIAAAFGLPAPIVAVIEVLIVIFAVLWLVSGIAGVNVPLRIR